MSFFIVLSATINLKLWVIQNWKLVNIVQVYDKNFRFEHSG